MSTPMSPKEMGKVQQDLDHFYLYRLPALLKMKEHVDSGALSQSTNCTESPDVGLPLGGLKPPD